MGQRFQTRVLQFRTAHVGEFNQVLFVVVPAAGQQTVYGFNAQFLAEVVQKLRVDFAVVHQPNRVSHFAKSQSLLDFFQRRFGDVVVQVQFRIPGDFNRVGFNAFRREDKVGVLQIVANNVVQIHQILAAVLGQHHKSANQVRRQFDE